MDITIKEIEYIKPYDYISGKLELNIYGKDINIKIINALRRVACDYIPTYAFPPELINIEENTSEAFNNDYMRTRLKFIPILNIDNGISYLHEEYWKEIEYNDIKRKKHENEKSIEININANNKTKEIINITTNDIKYYEDGKEIEPYNKEYPHLIIKLRTNERFKCHMKSAIGIGHKVAFWNAARNAYYIEENNKYKLTIESTGQITEYKIIRKACIYIMKKMENIVIEIERKIKKEDIIGDKIIKFILEGEDHTIGELLNYELQNHEDILGSGISKPDLLIDNITIKMTSNKGIPIEAIKETIKIIINKFKKIEEIIKGLEKNI